MKEIPMSMTVSINLSTLSTRDDEVLVDFQMENKWEAENLSNILASGPVQITRLAPLTLKEVKKRYEEKIKKRTAKFREESHFCPNPEKMNEIGNAYAEDLLTLHNEACDEMARISTDEEKGSED